MNKILVSIAFAMLLLTGCEEPKELGTFTNVKVKDTKIIEHCSRGCWHEYNVVLEKNGTVVELDAGSEEMFKLMKKGNVLNITYNEEYYITKVTFPMMEKKEVVE